MTDISRVGPHGYIHGWIKVGAAGSAVKAYSSTRKERDLANRVHMHLRNARPSERSWKNSPAGMRTHAGLFARDMAAHPKMASDPVLQEHLANMRSTLAAGDLKSFEKHRSAAETRVREHLSMPAGDIKDRGHGDMGVLRAAHGDSGIPGVFPHQLATWWEHGAGAAKIGWGRSGDFDRCVRLAVADAHMTPEKAKGFCNERHHAVLGFYPATHAAMEHKVGRSAVTTPAQGNYDADGLDESWDGDCSDLPDLTGLDVQHFEAAEKAMGMTTGPGEQPVARAMPKLGTGARFAKLKSSLAAKGASNPGALAAYIGRRKFGKAKFGKLASKARGGHTVTRFTLFRPYPLEECRILRSSDGQQYGSGRVVEAYAAVFDEPVEIHDRQGHYEEIIDRSAFDRTLTQITRARGGLAGAVRVLYNHGRTMGGAEAPEFQRPIGKPLEVRPEGRGLLTRTEYNNSPLAEEILENIKAGSITGQSFEGPDYESSPALRGPGDKYRARNGVLPKVRRMILGLQNYGPALYAAYPGAEFLGVVRMSFPGSGDELEPGFAEDEEYAPADEGDVTGGAPEDATSARYHQHALYRLQSQEARERIGLTW